MVLVVVGVEAAVDTGGVVVIIAFTLAVVASLIAGANDAALATIQLVVFQVDTGPITGVGVADALAVFAVFLGTTSLIAGTTVCFIGLRVHAGMLAGQQHLAAAGHAFSFGTELVTGGATPTTVLGVRARIDAGVSTCGLALLADEATLARDACSLAGADGVARPTVLLRCVRVDAKIVADHIGSRTYGAASPIDTKLVDRARDPACATVLEASGRVDTAVLAEHLEAQAVDHACAVFADLVIQARLPTASAVHDVQLIADTLTVTVDLRGVCTDLALAMGLVTVREVGIRFPAASQRRNQREHDKPQLLWKCQ
jgi:hypothetical protein